MRFSMLIAGIIFVVSSGLQIDQAYCGVDYDKIDRKIKKEPVYKTQKPLYALLLFGPNAKTKVWVVKDGEEIYIDLNSNGKLTDEGEHFANLVDCKNLFIIDQEVNSVYTIGEIKFYEQEKPRTIRMTVNLEIKGDLNYKQFGVVELQENMEKAFISHFHGPLSIGPRTPKGSTILKGVGPIRMTARVGTMSVQHGCWVAVIPDTDEGKSAFPVGVMPVIEIEFRSSKKNSRLKSKQFKLDKFC